LEYAVSVVARIHALGSDSTDTAVDQEACIATIDQKASVQVAARTESVTAAEKLA
jgi:hypothetical protein